MIAVAVSKMLVDSRFDCYNRRFVIRPLLFHRWVTELPAEELVERTCLIVLYIYQS